VIDKLPPGLFGLQHSNLDFSTAGEGAWGKNKFNNAFPLALVSYMHQKGYDFPYLEVDTDSGVPRIVKRRIDAVELLGDSPSDCFFEFEGKFSKFEDFVDGSPNKSDVVVWRNSNPRAPLRALEIKLTVVPDSSTVGKSRDLHASEFVTRPLMVELLATNICMAFGLTGRAKLNQLLLQGLGNPNNWDWKSRVEMFPKLGKVQKAIELVLCDAEVGQTPMVIQPIWRTVSDSIRLDESCFDLLVWSDFALAMLYLRALVTDRTSEAGDSSISREARSAIWLVKMLWDYSTAGQLTMNEVIKEIAYGAQQDKAGTFSGRVMHEFMNGPELLYPRVKRQEIGNIILGDGIRSLSPERRLDASLFVEDSLRTAKGESQR
jgi:hypothetical protein